MSFQRGMTAFGAVVHGDGPMGQTLPLYGFGRGVEEGGHGTKWASSSKIHNDTWSRQAAA